MGIKKENLSIMKSAADKKGGLKVERVPSGIPGFDELVEGGFPRQSTILVAGGPGTGKTIFCLQYLVNGIEQFNEKGLFVTFEQKMDAVKKQAMQFGWDLEKYEKQGKLKILSVPIDSISDKTIHDIRIMVGTEKIKRLAIDSLSTLVINAPLHTNVNDLALKEVTGKLVLSQPIMGDYLIKKFIYNFVGNLRGLDCTSLLIGETSGEPGYITRDTISEFVCDGILIINFESLGGDYSRSLIVRKMRQTKNNEDVHPVEIGKKGIVVHKIE